jgi:hypothetical protein
MQTDNFKKDDGTGMVPPANAGAPAGAVTSNQTPKRYPKQGIKIDRNKHGIRRETSTMPKQPKKTGRKKV